MSGTPDQNIQSTLAHNNLGVNDYIHNPTLRGYFRWAKAGISDTVTQLTSTTTGVTCNANHGQILTYATQTLTTGQTAAFTVTNNQVEANCSIVATVSDRRTNSASSMIIPAVQSVSSGSFVLAFTNVGTASLTAGFVISFFVVKP